MVQFDHTIRKWILSCFRTSHCEQLNMRVPAPHSDPIWLYFQRSYRYKRYNTRLCYNREWPDWNGVPHTPTHSKIQYLIILHVWRMASIQQLFQQRYRTNDTCMGHPGYTGGLDTDNDMVSSSSCILLSVLGLDAKLYYLKKSMINNQH